MNKYSVVLQTVRERADDLCWPWDGVHSRGYGRVTLPVSWRTVPTHVVAYELRYGPIPTGLELDHKCRNRGCWNPDHVEPVTHQTNSQRGVHPRSDFCPQ